MYYTLHSAVIKADEAFLKQKRGQNFKIRMILITIIILFEKPITAYKVFRF